MKLITTLLTVAVAVSVDAGDLKVVAEHAGGFSKGLSWRMSIKSGRVSVFASDGARNAAFEITNEQRRELAALIDETRFFALKAQYGVAATELKSCSMAISLGGRKSKVTIHVYSKRKPPNDAESLELRRAYRVWDALKALGHLTDLADDCRGEFDISEIGTK